jgi:triosephosphate isomerase
MLFDSAFELDVKSVVAVEPKSAIGQGDRVGLDRLA